jgi:hypothetical protein
MNKLSPRNLLVAAALFGVSAESAWSEEAMPSVPAAATEQTASPGTDTVPENTPTPTPNRGGYAQPWQQPPQWHAPPPPPPGYGHFRPYYPPYPQYRSVPAAPTENPLSVKLKQTQEQLGVKNTELNTTNEQMATLQAEQQTTRAALQQAQSETDAASQQLSTVMEQVDILKNVLTELKARLDAQNTKLLSALEADAAAENDNEDSADASVTEQVQSPTTTSAQPENAGSEQTEVRDNELTEPEAQ